MLGRVLLMFGSLTYGLKRRTWMYIKAWDGYRSSGKTLERLQSDAVVGMKEEVNERKREATANL